MSSKQWIEGPVCHIKVKPPTAMSAALTFYPDDGSAYLAGASVVGATAAGVAGVAAAAVVVGMVAYSRQGCATGPFAAFSAR